MTKGQEAAARTNGKRNEGSGGRRIGVAEMEARVGVVVELTLRGLSSKKIAAHLATATRNDEEGKEVPRYPWGVNLPIRTLYRYVSRAAEYLRTASTFDVDKEKGLARYRLEMLFAKALAAKDYATCRRIQRDISEITGVVASRSLGMGLNLKLKAADGTAAEVSIETPRSSRPTDEQRAAELTRLITLARANGANVRLPNELGTDNSNN